MRDLITVARKEWWVLGHSARRWYWFLPLLALPLLFEFGDGSQAVVPIPILFALLPAFFAMAFSGQIALDSILSEKRTKTLEVLLSTNMPTLAIVLGKVIPAATIGYILAQLFILVSALSFVESYNIFASWFNVWLAFIAPLLMAYVAGCACIVATILVPDEKVAPMAGIMILAAPMVLLGYFSQWTMNSIGIVSITLGAVLFCVFTTWLAARALKNVPLITQI